MPAKEQGLGDSDEEQRGVFRSTDSGERVMLRKDHLSTEEKEGVHEGCVQNKDACGHLGDGRSDRLEHF